VSARSDGRNLGRFSRKEEEEERAGVDPDQTLRPKNADATGVSFIDTARFVTNVRAVDFKTARITQ